MALLRYLIVMALLLTTSAFAAENPDVQSPEEIEAARRAIERDFANVIEPKSLSTAQRQNILIKYQSLDPDHIVPSDLLAEALIYFDANKEKFPNPNYITIVDFKPRSSKYRFYVINVADGSVERFHTTHGKGSDPKDKGYAERFGNVINSGRSSLGFVRTAEVYWGKYKRSIRLDGLSATNSNLRERAVVVHGWDDVKEADVKQGRSMGCMTLDWSIKDSVIDKIKEGSLLYAGVSK